MKKRSHHKRRGSVSTLMLENQDPQTRLNQHRDLDIFQQPTWNKAILQHYRQVYTILLLQVPIILNNLLFDNKSLNISPLEYMHLLWHNLINISLSYEKHMKHMPQLVQYECLVLFVLIYYSNFRIKKRASWMFWFFKSRKRFTISKICWIFRIHCNCWFIKPMLFISENRITELLSITLDPDKLCQASSNRQRNFHSLIMIIVLHVTLTQWSNNCSLHHWHQQNPTKQILTRQYSRTNHQSHHQNNHQATN